MYNLFNIGLQVYSCGSKVGSEFILRKLLGQEEFLGFGAGLSSLTQVSFFQHGR